MLAMEEVLCELSDHEKRKEQGLPPGFRFHPTDEELITFYLASKVFNGSFTNVKFAEVDLNRCEPWELPDVAKMGEREWYVFSLRDRKYPTGLRTNRATGSGYWKATGKDKEVYSNSATLLGMKKTLVFYKGRAPRGEKTKWVMHEYRLDSHFSLPHTSKEEWVICRIFHKCGEKRTTLVQLQGHWDASSSPTKSSLLAPLHASPTSFTLELECESQSSYHSRRDFQSQLLIHHHHDSHPPHLFPLHAPPEIAKTEDGTVLYPYQLLDDPNNNLRWVNKLNQNPSNIPLEVESSLMAISGAANAQVRDMSTSTPFNRVGLQQVLLDAQIGIDYWPLAQHV